MADVQIAQMTAFIAAEAKDKCAEIRLKTEEDANIEKLRIVQNEKAKVVEDIAKLAKKADTQRKVAISAQKSAALMQQVRVRDEHYSALRTDVLNGLAAVGKDANKAKDVYAKLIAQSALALNEKEVTVKCLEKDASVVKGAFSNAASLVSAECKKAGGKDLGVNFTLDSTYLPKEAVGGVSCSVAGGKIVSDNTFERRVAQAMQDFKPALKEMIWGR